MTSVTAKTYRASGKCSPLAVPCFLGALLILVPVFCLFFAVFAWYVPYFTADAVFFIGAAMLLIRSTSRLSIVAGKVRSQLAAFLMGLLLTAAAAFCILYFHSLLVVCQSGSVSLLGKDIPLSIPSLGAAVGLLRDPSRLLEVYRGILADGIMVYQRRGFTLVLRGNVLAVAFVVTALAALVFMAGYFMMFAARPFCEDSRSWAKRQELTFSYIAEPEALLQQLAAGDMRVFEQIRRLDSAGGDHSEWELFMANGSAEFYLGIENKKVKREGGRGTGDKSFQTEKLAENLAISRELGMTLWAFKKVE